MGIIALPFAMFLGLPSFIGERRWWLVPGGVIVREHRLWRRTMRAGLVRPQDTSIFVDFRTATALFLLNGSACMIRLYKGESAWAFIAGWISTARPPTDEEVLAFLGRDAKLPIDFIRLGG